LTYAIFLGKCEIADFFFSLNAPANMKFCLYAPFKVDDDDNDKNGRASTPQQQPVDFIVEKSESYILYLLILKRDINMFNLIW